MTMQCLHLNHVTDSLSSIAEKWVRFTCVTESRIVNFNVTTSCDVSLQMYASAQCMTSGGLIQCQARRQGGFEGVRANPPFDLQIILYTPLNCTFKYPTV